jgi:hypothetical protein
MTEHRDINECFNANSAQISLLALTLRCIQCFFCFIKCNIHYLYRPIVKDCASAHSDAPVVLHISTILTWTYVSVSVMCTCRTCVELIQSVTITTKCLKDSFNRFIFVSGIHLTDLYLWAVSFMPKSLYPRYSLDRRLGWFQSRSGSMLNTLKKEFLLNNI